MSQHEQPREWRDELRASRCLLLIWSMRPEEQPRQQERLAYAMALGKPICVVLLPGRRVPEDLCAGYAPLRVVRTHGDTDTAPVLAAMHALIGEPAP